MEKQFVLDVDRMPNYIVGITCTNDERYAYVREAYDVRIVDLQSYKELGKLRHSKCGWIVLSRNSDRGWVFSHASNERARFSEFLQGAESQELRSCIVPDYCELRYPPTVDRFGNAYVAMEKSLWCWKADSEEPVKIYQLKKGELFDSLCCHDDHVYVTVYTMGSANEYLLDYHIQQGSLRKMMLYEILRHPERIGKEYVFSSIVSSKAGNILVLSYNSITEWHFLDQELHEGTEPPHVTKGGCCKARLSPDGQICATLTSLNLTLIICNIAQRSFKEYYLGGDQLGFDFSNDSKFVYIYSGEKNYSVNIE